MRRPSVIALWLALATACSRRESPGEIAQHPGAPASVGATPLPSEVPPPFEGCLVRQHFSPSLPEGTVKATENICIKGELVRTETSETPGVVSVIDFSARKAERGIIGGGAAPPLTLTDIEPGTMQLKKTAQRDRVAGVACDLWVVERASSSYELCVASNIYGAPMLQKHLGFALTEANSRFFPLRSVLIRNGKRDLISQVASITPKPLPSRDFEPPR